MKNSTKILLGIIMVILIGLAVTLLIQSPHTTNEPGPAGPNFPNISTTSSQITIQGTNNNIINTNNFLNNEDVEPVEGSLAGSYNLDINSESYNIFYSEVDNTFTISLLNTPLEETREQAQNRLLDLLGVPKDQLCRLKTMVTVPYWLNEELAGKNLGISFCLGSISLKNY